MDITWAIVCKKGCWLSTRWPDWTFGNTTKSAYCGNKEGTTVTEDLHATTQPGSRQVSAKILAGVGSCDEQFWQLVASGMAGTSGCAQPFSSLERKLCAWLVPEKHTTFWELRTGPLSICSSGWWLLRPQWRPLHCQHGQPSFCVNKERERKRERERERETRGSLNGLEESSPAQRNPQEPRAPGKPKRRRQ